MDSSELLKQPLAAPNGDFMKFLSPLTMSLIALLLIFQTPSMANECGDYLSNGEKFYDPIPENQKFFDLTHSTPKLKTFPSPDGRYVVIFDFGYLEAQENPYYDLSTSNVSLRSYQPGLLLDRKTGKFVELEDIEFKMDQFVMAVNMKTSLHFFKNKFVVMLSYSGVYMASYEYGYDGVPTRVPYIFDEDHAYANESDTPRRDKPPGKPLKHWLSKVPGFEGYFLERLENNSRILDSKGNAVGANLPGEFSSNSLIKTRDSIIYLDDKGVLTKRPDSGPATNVSTLSTTSDSGKFLGEPKESSFKEIIAVNGDQSKILVTGQSPDRLGFLGNKKDPKYIWLTLVDLASGAQNRIWKKKDPAISFGDPINTKLNMGFFFKNGRVGLIERNSQWRPHLRGKDTYKDFSFLHFLNSKGGALHTVRLEGFWHELIVLDNALALQGPTGVRVYSSSGELIFEHKEDMDLVHSHIHKVSESTFLVSHKRNSVVHTLIDLNLKTSRTLTGRLLHVDPKFERIVLSPFATESTTDINLPKNTSFQVFDGSGNLVYFNSRMDFSFNNIQFTSPNSFFAYKRYEVDYTGNEHLERAAGITHVATKLLAEVQW